ncbi:MAG: glycoside hydrolase family 2 [Verrucomicrobiae bacterium]|nr:glycoside hydrolase family 2 [Verrucomicrobiae bacterium]
MKEKARKGPQEELQLGRGHPRPQMRRKHWESLNGVWEFALDPSGSVNHPDCVQWDSHIEVPFAPETRKSGIHHPGFYEGCWYRRGFKAPPLGPEERLLVHFGAVDYQATVWVNGFYAGKHEGGYTPFTRDVTDFLKPDQEQIVIVRAKDDPADLEKPRGKQDWHLEPHSIWYPRTSGIWQTVWIEKVPATRLECLSWIPNLVRWELAFEAWIEGEALDDHSIHLQLNCGDRVLASDRYQVLGNEVHRRIALSDPGIDDFRNELLWAPESPTLIDAKVQLLAPDGKVVDEVSSYTALRSVQLEGNRFVLNGRPYPLRLILDQGYWPATGLTAPDDAAFIQDIELVKAMGFNGVRKHQKIEDPRFLYWADRLGLLVWGEMPSAYRFTQKAVNRVIREWTEAIRRDFSHPCLVAWVPINESWGVPNLPHNPVERHYVQALFHLTKTLDATRPVVGNDGWESVATDIIGIHDYDGDPERLAHRYHGDRMLPHLLKQERPGGRLLVVGENPSHEHPVVLSEFGGIALDSNNDKAWGYSKCRTAEEFQEHYCRLMEVVRSLGMLAGFCYTQFTDTYQEANGLLDFERQPKFPLEKIRAATLGPRKDR